MRKDAIYSLRLNSKIRDMLRKAAQVECRTVASLLNKIITDYLKQEGFLTGQDLGRERRSFLRESIPLPSRTIFKIGEKTDSIPSVVRDISLGGVKVIFPKDAEIKISPSSMLSYFELSIEFPKDNQELTFKCGTRHIRKTDSEIHVGASFENMSMDEIQSLRSYLN